jgi:hypothetical protein
LELKSALDIREGMADAIAIRLKESVSESQSKNKLGHTEMRGEFLAQVRVFDVHRRDAQPLWALNNNVGSVSWSAVRLARIGANSHTLIWLKLPGDEGCFDL